MNKFSDFYFDEKNKFNEEYNKVDVMKQTISDMFRDGKSVSDIEKSLKVKLVFPGSDDGNVDRFLISKTYQIVKESANEPEFTEDSLKRLREMKHRLKTKEKHNSVIKKFNMLKNKDKNK